MKKMLLVTCFMITVLSCTEQDKDVIFDVDDYIAMGAPSKLIIPEGYETVNFSMYKDHIDYSDKVEEIKFPSTLNLVIPDDFGGLAFVVDFKLEDFSIGRLDNLKNIDLSSNDNFIIRDGVLYTANEEIILGAIPNLVPKKLNISNEALIMANAAFANCDNIETLILPDSMRHIPRDAFSGCKNLTHLSLPSSLETIYYDAIGSDNLDSLYLPNSLLEIGIANNAISGDNLKIYINSDHPDKDRIIARYSKWSEVLVLDN